MERKTLYEVNEKIMSATDAEHIEEEIINMRMESFKLKLKIMELREVDTEETNVNRNLQTEQYTDGRFEEQIRRDRAAESQNSWAGIDAGADESGRDATAIVNCSVRRQAETKQMVNIQPLAGGSKII